MVTIESTILHNVANVVFVSPKTVTNSVPKNYRHQLLDRCRFTFRIGKFRITHKCWRIVSYIELIEDIGLSPTA